MHRARIPVIFVLTLTLALSVSAAPPRLWSAENIKWMDDPAIPGGEVSVTSGNPEKGAYAALHKWPGGTNVGMHYHTNATRGVVISGTLVVTPEGGSAVELGPGSYVYMPGMKYHSTTCKEGADCVFYAAQPGKGDAVMKK